jgi:hypothetical protein
MDINASLISEEHSTLNDFMNVVATRPMAGPLRAGLFKLGDGPQGRGYNTALGNPQR